MRSPLDAHAYCDPANFIAEQELVFGRSFLLAGLAEDVARHDDWITCEVGSRSVVVQNFRGTLRAFSNVCAHRQNRLRNAVAGNGPLRCGYHGWTYGEDGCARGVPARDGFAAEELREAKLRRHEVVLFGPLVFVRRAANEREVAERAFEEHLGSIHDRVRTVLHSSQHSFERFSLDLACNWKVLIENSIEGYHVANVHRDTIHKLAHRERECLHEGGSSFSDFEEHVDPKKKRLLARALPERPLAFDGYVHALLFPNVTVATAQGAFVIVTRTVPLAVDRCRLDVFMLESKHAESPSSRALLAAVSAMNAEFVRTTFREDASICESVQQGLADSESRSLLHDEHERRIHSFQLRIAAMMSAPQNHAVRSE